MRNKNIVTFAVLTAIWILSASCSTKKDTVFSRSVHSLATEYNILFNGYNGYIEGETNLLTGFNDDFTKLLSVDRFEADEDIKVFSEDIKDSNFKKAEEKATKAIQKHSMNIDNRERNPQIDEAFMLLGKTRYFSQRFIPSQEAFEYIIYNYPNSDKMAEARIWREKTNIQLYKEQIAIKNLKKIFKQEIVSRQNYAEAMATTAQAYMKLERLDSAATVLKIAADLTKYHIEKGRYNYILGQLYNILKNPGKAHAYFTKVVALNRRIPRVYLINAEIEILKLTSLTLEKNKQMVYEKLQKMIANRENRPFLDIIYRQLALYYLHNKNFNEAETNYHKSTKKTKNKSIKTFNYIDLAKMHFDLEHYTTASKYYDSIIANIDHKDERYYPTVKKKEHLKNIVKYELISQRDDSILKLVKMAPKDQEHFFKEYIGQLKLKEQKKQEKIEAAKKQKDSLAKKDSPPASGFFYFYNKTAMEIGKADFMEKWGNRPLKDNWKYSVEIEVAREDPHDENAKKENQPNQPKENEAYKPETYLSKIPKDKHVIDSIKTELNIAYYQLGLLYKDKFKNYPLAETKLKLLLNNNPSPELKLPVKYNLYKIYKETENRASEAIKKDILKNYPQSSFAKVLNNKNFDEEKETGEGEKLYAELYKKFKNEAFKEVIAISDENQQKLFGNNVLPKILMLKASAVARLYGLKDYEKILKEITLNYPNTFEAKMAQYLLENVVSPWSKKEMMLSSSTGKYWKVLFAFDNSEASQLDGLYQKISNLITDFSYDRLYLSKDIFSDHQMLLVVHGFSDKERAQGFQELLQVNPQYYVERKNFVLSSRDYEFLQVHKNLEQLNFQ